MQIDDKHMRVAQLHSYSKENQNKNIFINKEEKY